MFLIFIYYLFLVYFNYFFDIPRGKFKLFLLILLFCFFQKIVNSRKVALGVRVGSIAMSLWILIQGNNFWWNSLVVERSYKNLAICERRILKRLSQRDSLTLVSCSSNSQLNLKRSMIKTKLLNNQFSLPLFL